MARRTKGTPGGILKWALGHRVAVEASDRREFRLCTEGLADVSVVASWPARHSLAAGEDWAREVAESAQDDCDIRSMASAYKLELYDPQEERALAAYPMRLTPQETGLESATAEGIVSQVLRHKEAMMRMHFSNSQALMRAQNEAMERMGTIYGEIVDKLGKRLEVAENMQLKAIETWAAAMEALHSGAEREEEREAQARRAAKLDGIIDFGLEVAKHKAKDIVAPPAQTPTDPSPAPKANGAAPARLPVGPVKAV